MRHSNRNKKFGRVKRQRTEFLRSLARSLILKERIETTLPRAKALRPVAERLITHARTNTLASRRLVLKRLGERNTATKKLFDEIGPRMKNRNGGYTRITRLPKRTGDASQMAIIELI